MTLWAYYGIYQIDMQKITELFRQAAQTSTCNNAHLGAVIVATDGTCIMGWNGPPERSGKHASCLLGKSITASNRIHCPSVHAEIRAICKAAELGCSIKGGTIYLSEWFPCTPCAIAIIQAGLNKLVVTEDLDFGKDDCYNFKLALELLNKAGIEIDIRKDFAIK